jgi:hypothetical protein
MPRVSLDRIVGLEVFMAMVMKHAVFWHMVPCGFCKNRRFGEKCQLTLQLVFSLLATV